MTNDLAIYQRRVDKLLASYKLAAATVKQEKTKLTEAKAQVTAAEQAQQVAQAVAQTIQQQAHQRIASVVTRCLKAVFGDDAYEFRIEFEKKRGKTSAMLQFVKDENTFDPTSSAGGGCVDIASFALRVANIIMSKPLSRRLFVADEPFKYVNGTEYQEKVASLLLMLAEEMGIQFIMAADDEWLKVGHVIEV